MTDSFLTEDLPNYLLHIEENTQPLWGNMTATQMVDHLYSGLLLAQKANDVPIRIPSGKLEAYRSFLMSDKPLPKFAEQPTGFVEFRPDPSPSLELAVQRLLEEVPVFFKAMDQPGYRTVHDDFGELDADMALVLHRKHVRHHLAQFGLLER